MKTIPINVDRNVSHKEFEGEPFLLVTSVFRTIQGEGPYAGTEAVFVRLAGCNIGLKEDCPWCDTYFAVDKATHYSPNALAELVCQHIVQRQFVRPLIVLTGGEPLLQFEQLVGFMVAMYMRGVEPIFQFETNGLLLRAAVFARLQVFADRVHKFSNHRPAVTLVVSPKIPHTAETYRTIPGDWTAGLALGFDIHLKYVVTADPSSPYYRMPSMALESCGWPITRVWVSGMTDYTGAITGALPGKPVSLFDLPPDALAQTAKNYAYAARLALVYGYRVSYQTHLLAGLE